MYVSLSNYASSIDFVADVTHCNLSQLTALITANNKAETQIDVAVYLVGVCETLEQSCWDITDLIKK